MLIFRGVCQSGNPYSYRAGFFNTRKATRLNEHIRHIHTARNTNTCKQMKVVTNHPENENLDTTRKCKLNTHLVIQENPLHPPRTKKKTPSDEAMKEALSISPPGISGDFPVECYYP